MDYLIANNNIVNIIIDWNRKFFSFQKSSGILKLQKFFQLSRRIELFKKFIFKIKLEDFRIKIKKLY